MEDPEVGESQLVEEGHVRSEVGHGVVLRSLTEPGRAPMLLQGGDRLRQYSCRISVSTAFIVFQTIIGVPLFVRKSEVIK